MEQKTNWQPSKQQERRIRRSFYIKEQKMFEAGPANQPQLPMNDIKKDQLLWQGMALYNRGERDCYAAIMFVRNDIEERMQYETSRGEAQRIPSPEAIQLLLFAT